MLNRVFCLSFQDPATPIMEGIIDLHNTIMFYLIVIFIFVFYIFIAIIRDFYVPVKWPTNVKDISLREILLENNKVVHGTWIEFFWTTFPSIILIMIASPSIALLYSIDELNKPALTVKVIGHQWYWSYEYANVYVSQGDILKKTFDSYMIPTSELKKGQFRLLEVDNALVLPEKCHIRILVSAADVLHSFAIPALGVKIDAVPGRLNQVQLFIKRQGVFYGQCSEICGTQHGFMPISLRVVDFKKFKAFLKS
jgi:cytochrome c oxidase subunit 2